MRAGATLRLRVCSLVLAAVASGLAKSAPLSPAPAGQQKPGGVPGEKLQSPAALITNC